MITINLMFPLYYNKNDNQHTGKEGEDITMKSVSGNSGKSLFLQETSYGGSAKRGKKKMSLEKLHL